MPNHDSAGGGSGAPAQDAQMDEQHLVRYSGVDALIKKRMQRNNPKTAVQHE